MATAPKKTASAPRKTASKAATQGWTPAPEPAPAASPGWTQAPPPAQPVQAGAFDEKQYAMFLHMSALGGLFLLGGLTFIGPLIMWIIKKDQSPYVDRHGRAAVDFHLSILIYEVVLVVGFIAITIATFGIGAILLIIPLILVILAAIVLLVILPILAGLQASQGRDYHYPMSLRLLRPRQ